MGLEVDAKTRVIGAVCGLLGLVGSAVAQPTITNATQGTTHATLADAVSASNPDDVIEIGEGVLYERGVILANRVLTIRGQGAGQTIIDGDHIVGRILNIRAGSNIVLEDMTLRNGLAQTNGGYGGGAIRVNADAWLTVRDCAFENNHDNDDGFGAIILDSLNPAHIERCVFSANTGFFGASIGVWGGGPVTVAGCLFTGDNGLVSVYVSPGGSGDGARLTNCTFADLGTTYGVMANTSDTFLDNCAIDDSTDGAVVVNSGTLTATRCLYPGATGDNIDGVPTFANPGAGDYSLAAGSLGIDAGDSFATATYCEDTTIGGAPRLADDPATTDTGVPIFGETVDIGAYEFGAAQPPLIEGQPVSVLTEIGSTAEFSVEAPDAVYFNWYKHGVRLTDDAMYSGTETPTLTVSVLDGSAAGLYSAKVSTSGRVEVSVPAGLVIVPNLCLADFNEDGLVNTGDVLSFLNVYTAGCP